MGAGGQECGVALYEQKGAVKKLARLVDAGRMRDAASLGSLAVTLDDEPRWAAKAIGPAGMTGVRGARSLHRVRAGGPAWAVALPGPQGPNAHAELEA
jgi:hypothetical protein